MDDTSSTSARLGVLGVVLASLAALAVVGLLPLVAVAQGVAGAAADLVDLPPLPDDVTEMSAGSVVLDRDGERLAVLEAEHRVDVTSDDLPAHLVDAVVATEDQRFFAHSGVAWQGALRAALDGLREGRITAGGSGITQQLVKNVVVGDDATLSRKVREAAYAVQLESRLTKREIITAYLNDAYFGQGASGVGTAAERYWGTTVDRLSVAQAATLAGMIRAPSTTDPIDHPEAALARRDVVLAQMVETGRLDPDAAAAAAAEPLDLRPTPAPPARLPAMEAYLRSVLDAHPALGVSADERRQTYERGGLEIRTTLDADLQTTAEGIIGDWLDGRHQPTSTLGALTAVDPRTGEVLVVASGPREFGVGPGQTQVNAAVAGAGGSGRQAGSAFKPFELVAALEAGITPSYTVDTPSPYEPTRACSGSGWEPESYTGADGGPVDMAAATASSDNVYFAHLVDRTGPEPLVEAAARMGIESELSAICPLVLGTGEVFPLEMAAAYGTLAADGMSCTPYTIAEIRDRSGQVVGQGDGDCHRAVEAEVARRVTDMLEGVVSHGTASGAVDVGRPAAGKTGTTQDHSDAWFVGYLPQLSVSAWVGPEQPSPMTHPACGGPVTGGCLPARMWDELVGAAIAELDLAPLDFAAPQDLASATVPDVAGRDVDRARRALERAGFVVDEASVTDWRDEGTAVGTAPAGGSSAPRGSLVTLRVSDGAGDPPTVDDLAGLSSAEARAAVEGTGARLRVVEVGVADASRHGRVLAQSPVPGAPAVSRLGRPLTVTVQVGRPLRPGEAPPRAVPSPGAAPPASEPADAETSP